MIFKCGEICSILGNFACFFVVYQFFQINFLQKFLWEYHQSVKQFRPRSCRPDLSPNSLQKLSVDDTSWQSIKVSSVYIFWSDDF